MSLANRALWVIDRRLAEPLTLAEIAAACGVSRCHLAHAFGEAVGMTVMDYVRARRLSEAARALAEGAPDILQVALASGYGSHEAFTRAFGAAFAATPEAVRRLGSTAGLALTEPRELAPAAPPRLSPPRFVETAGMLAVGLVERRSWGAPRAIVDQWRRFGPWVGAIAGQVGIPLGILIPVGEEGGFDYACAVEVTGFAGAPAELARLTVPAQRYAVFRHAGHVSALGATYRAALEAWLPEAGLTLAEAPSLERHMASFDPATGEGGLEIWLPLA